MKFCTIGSGSRGNMTYIETNEIKILLDAGISLRDAKKRTAIDNIDYSNIDAVFITHEHSDHIKFLSTILKQTNATLYINQLSFEKLDISFREKLANYKIKFIEANKKYRINDLEVLTLKLSHDSANVFGYVFISDDKRLAYITDTGFFPIHYVNILKNVDGLIIESNHDVTMLLESTRSWYLKERILSPHGHMSNYICQQLLVNVLNDRHKVVVLAHISLECNSVRIIEEEVIHEVKKVYQGEMLIATQKEALRLYNI